MQPAAVPDAAVGPEPHDPALIGERDPGRAGAGRERADAPLERALVQQRDARRGRSGGPPPVPARPGASRSTARSPRRRRAPAGAASGSCARLAVARIERQHRARGLLHDPHAAPVAGDRGRAAPRPRAGARRGRSVRGSIARNPVLVAAEHPHPPARDDHRARGAADPGGGVGHRGDRRRSGGGGRRRRRGRGGARRRRAGRARRGSRAPVVADRQPDGAAGDEQCERRAPRHAAGGAPRDPAGARPPPRSSPPPVRAPRRGPPRRARPRSGGAAADPWPAHAGPRCRARAAAPAEPPRAPARVVQVRPQLRLVRRALERDAAREHEVAGRRRARRRRSARRPARPRICSGATKSSVPTQCSDESGPHAASAALASPKSVRYTWPSASTITLRGLTSRWT